MNCPEYPKILTVWERDAATKHRTLVEGQWSCPEFAWLAELPWLWTEKIDGTNVRVLWDCEAKTVTYGGRADSAQMPTFLFEKLCALLPDEKFAALYPATTLTLYGEGYGAKIQKGGGNYIPGGVSFVGFDVLCGGLWLERSNVLDVFRALGVDVVPDLGTGPLSAAIEMVRAGFASRIGTAQAEGMVMRPPGELFTRRGHRIIAKVKHKDFAQEEAR